MEPTGLGIRRDPASEGTVARFVAGHERLGLDGLLARPGRRARLGRAPAPGARRGFRWGWRDAWDRTWWPQGIDARPDATILIASWYAQERRGVRQGSRITVVDLRERIPRYHHVLLVRVTDDNAEPVQIHAGGLAWDGDRLLVAATRGGLREFRLSDITALGAGETVHGYAVVLPQTAGLTATTAAGEQLRYSFVSRAKGSSADHDHLVVGEYSPGDASARVARLAVTADDAQHEPAADITEVHETAIPHLQGALRIDGVWMLGSSRGPRTHGDLWAGQPGAFVRHSGVLAPGPEDLAVSTNTGELWNLTEYPGRRWVYSLDLNDWLDSAKTDSGGR